MAKHWFWHLGFCVYIYIYATIQYWHIRMISFSVISLFFFLSSHNFMLLINYIFCWPKLCTTCSLLRVQHVINELILFPWAIIGKMFNSFFLVNSWSVMFTKNGFTLRKFTDLKTMTTIASLSYNGNGTTQYLLLFTYFIYLFKFFLQRWIKEYSLNIWD